MFPDLVVHLAECAPLVADTGSHSRYAADCLVRHLLAGDPLPAVTWSRALALGLDPAAAALEVEAGIGFLRITPAAVAWRPVQPRSGPPPPPPLPAPDALRIARLAACHACSRFGDGRCTIAGCGCAGQGTPAALLSKCPMGQWPPP